MNHSSFSRVIALLAFACGLSALTACNELPKRRGASVVEGVAPEGAIDAVNPTDIVVVPVIDETGTTDFPREAMRAAFQRGLVKRRYSPLSIEYVDLSMIDGVYSAGSLEEDAVLEIIAESWDTTYTEARGAVGIRAVVRLIDAQSQGLLWSGRIDQTFELGSFKDRATTRQRFLAEGCDQIAAEVLAALPAHDARP